MIRIQGIIKVVAVLVLDFFALNAVFNEPGIAAIVVGLISIYVFVGGSLTVEKEGGVRADNLPEYDRMKLNAAKEQIIEDIRIKSSTNLSSLKIYLIPGDDDFQATAYGANRISVSEGTLRNADPVTLTAVLSHEASHILNSDPEFSRAVFCSVSLLVASVSVISAATVVIVFLLFLLLSLFRSFLGFLAFRGTTSIFRGFFSLIQKVIVLIYRTFLGIANRHAEYRSDHYACELGYGTQLAHFLEYAGRDPARQMTLTELLYRSHPSTPSRIARIENYINDNQNSMIVKKDYND